MSRYELGEGRRVTLPAPTHEARVSVVRCGLGSVVGRVFLCLPHPRPSTRIVLGENAAM